MIESREQKIARLEARVAELEQQLERTNAALHIAIAAIADEIDLIERVEATIAAGEEDAEGRVLL